MLIISQHVCTFDMPSSNCVSAFSLLISCSHVKSRLAFSVSFHTRTARGPSSHLPHHTRAKRLFCFTFFFFCQRTTRYKAIVIFCSSFPFVCIWRCHWFTVASSPSPLRGHYTQTDVSCFWCQVKCCIQPQNGTIRKKRNQNKSKEERKKNGKINTYSYHNKLRMLRRGYMLLSALTPCRAR